MKHLQILILAMTLMMSATITHAQIDLSNINTPVYYRGSSEFGGAMFINVKGDEFADATPETPVFVEFKLDSNVKTSRTLVDLTSEDPSYNEPIYLAMYLSAPSENTSLEAPPETISIVRWIKGESSIWLRVQHNSSSWISENEVSRAPGSEVPVSLVFGYSARFMAESMADIPDQHKNLPFNTRNPNQDLANPEPQESVSTLICLDLSNSSVTPSGSTSAVEYYPAAYESDAQLAPGIFEAGTPVNISWGGAFRLAGAKDRICVVAPNSFPTRACEQDSSTGFATVENHLTLNFNCLSGGDFLLANLNAGATLTLQTTEMVRYGFAENGAWFEGDAPGEVLLSEPFDVDGRILYHSLELRWNGESQRLQDLVLAAMSQLQVPQNSPAMDLLLSWNLVLVNHGDETDETPYTGLDQAANCGASSTPIGSGIWHFGTWGCGVPNERLVPHITKTSGGFNTGLLVANTGPEPASYTISVYHASGAAAGDISGQLEGNQTSTYQAETFNLPEGGYLSIFSEEGVTATATYQSVGENSGPAHVGEAATASSAWRIYPGNEAITWDGVALVNTGSSPAQIVAILKNEANDTLETITLDSANAGQKILTLLTGLFSQTGNYYEIRSNQPLALTALRGTWSSEFLWENKALPIQ